MTYLEPFKQGPADANPDHLHEQHFLLSDREAEAASPEAMAVCGEEDPGEGLEFLVTGD